MENPTPAHQPPQSATASFVADLSPITGKMAEVLALKAKYAGIEVSDKETLKIARAAKRQMVTLRTDADKQLKAINEGIKNLANRVKEKHERYTNLCRAVEGPLSEKIAAYEKAEAEKREQQRLAQEEQIDRARAEISKFRARHIEALQGIKDAAAINDYLAGVQQTPPAHLEFLGGEFALAILSIRDTAAGRITQIELAAQRAEMEREMEQLRAERARLAAESEERIRVAAAEHERLISERDAERRRVQELERVEQERVAAAERADRERAALEAARIFNQRAGQLSFIGMAQKADCFFYENFEVSLEFIKKCEEDVWDVRLSEFAEVIREKKARAAAAAAEFLPDADKMREALNAAGALVDTPVAGTLKTEIARKVWADICATQSEFLAGAFQRIKDECR